MKCAGRCVHPCGEERLDCVLTCRHWRKEWVVPAALARTVVDMPPGSKRDDAALESASKPFKIVKWVQTDDVCEFEGHDAEPTDEGTPTGASLLSMPNDPPTSSEHVPPAHAGADSGDARAPALPRMPDSRADTPGSDLPSSQAATESQSGGISTNADARATDAPTPDLARTPTPVHAEVRAVDPPSLEAVHTDANATGEAPRDAAHPTAAALPSTGLEGAPLAAPANASRDAGQA